MIPDTTVDDARPSAPAREHAPSLGLVAGAVLLAAVFAARVYTLGLAPHDADEFMFALGGRDVLQGRLPPAGVFDNKPVGLLYLFALAERIGGVSVAAIHGLGALCAALTAGACYLSARRLRLPAGLAIVPAALLSVEIVCLGGWLTMSEVVACPLLAGANLLLLREDRERPAVLLGVAALFGLACQVSYLAAPAVALSMAALLIERALDPRRRLSRALLLGTGAAAAIVLVWLPQMAEGGWWRFAQEQAAYYRQYRPAQPSSPAGLLTVAFPLVLFLLPFLAAALDPRSALRAVASRAWLPLALQVLGVLAATTVSNRFYPHYLILALPALSVMLALVLAAMPEAQRRLAAVVSLICAAAYLAPNAILLGGWPEAARLERQAASLIETTVGQDQAVLVFDETPAIYYLSDSRIPGRIAFVSHYMPSCGEVRMATPRAVLDAAIRRKARMILLGSQCPADFDAGAIVRRSGYQFLRRLADRGRIIDAYVRAGAGQASRRRVQSE